MPMKTKSILMIMIIGASLMAVSGFLLMQPEPVNAQCGSQASSCKNCHEVQGEMPVNNDGTDWHQAHAFGDFCEFCHAGNVQSPVMEEAHVGMVDPLADVEAACSSCHGDYQELAAGYASTLGVELGAGTGPASDTSEEEALSAPDQETGSQVNNCVDTEVVDLDQVEMVDFTRQYEETVLGIRDLNRGNLILLAFSGLLVVGGGLFVVLNENWLTISTRPVPESVDGFPAEDVALLPELEKIDDTGRKALRKLLKKPEKASKIFKAVTDLND